MPLAHLKCTDFRCLESFEIDLDPRVNLIYGKNAAGKTSVLEAIGYLGRGRSFRGAGNKELIRHGAEEFLIVGRVETETGNTPLGVRNSKNGLEVHANGEKCYSASALAEILPLQIIDPDIHELVAGGPEGRRRFIDWVAFHVEHGYAKKWKKFRRVLKQRNAAIKEGKKPDALKSWDKEFISISEEVDLVRRNIVDIINSLLEELGDLLLEGPVELQYLPGWQGNKSLAEALAAAMERDLFLGSTQVGPHRADVDVMFKSRKARKLVSRGQQKLVSCSLVLAATEMVQTHLERPVLLLVDDPAAELDIYSVARLMVCIEHIGCQVIATALDNEPQIFSSSPKTFHVEHGLLVG